VPHLTPATWDDPVVQQLTCAQQVEMRDLYDGDIEPGVQPSASDIAVVLVARDDEGTPIGCGALRSLEPGAAELKRMYVVPAARVRGIPRLLLVALEGEAAVGLYTAAGYRPTAAFGHHLTDDTDDSLYFARVLA
jgi:GNAT superfamily N-acetyltransferase